MRQEKLAARLLFWEHKISQKLCVRYIVIFQSLNHSYVNNTHFIIFFLFQRNVSEENGWYNSASTLFLFFPLHEYIKFTFTLNSRNNKTFSSFYLNNFKLSKKYAKDMCQDRNKWGSILAAPLSGKQA